MPPTVTKPIKVFGSDAAPVFTTAKIVAEETSELTVTSPIYPLGSAQAVPPPIVTNPINPLLSTIPPTDTDPINVLGSESVTLPVIPVLDPASKVTLPLNVVEIGWAIETKPIKPLGSERVI